METKVCFVVLQIIIYVDHNQNHAEFILSDERFDPKTYFLLSTIWNGNRKKCPGKKGGY